MATPLIAIAHQTRRGILGILTPENLILTLKNSCGRQVFWSLCRSQDDDGAATVCQWGERVGPPARPKAYFEAEEAFAAAAHSAAYKGADLYIEASSAGRPAAQGHAGEREIGTPASQNRLSRDPVPRTAATSTEGSGAELL